MPTMPFSLNPNLTKALDELSFLEFTPIQLAFIPRALAGKDVIGIAQTGTGKTAAYALPILMKLRHTQPKGPRALVLAPTKELVLQIAQHFQRLAVFTDMRILPFFAGVGITDQLTELQQGVDVMISTPGRFLELYAHKAFSPKTINTLVLDEADRMLEIAFRAQLYDILEVLPTKRQNFLLSATYPEKMEKLTQDFLEFPEHVAITPQATPAASVRQVVYHIPNWATKLAFLRYLLRETPHEKVLIFVRSKQNANAVYEALRLDFSRLGVLHGNKSQNTRLHTLQAFRENELQYLIATDIAARGLDIPAVSHVYNIEVPLDYQEYIHRIGRTGRAFATGDAVSFANKAEKMHITRIEQLMGTKIPVLDLPADFLPIATEKTEIIAIEREIDTLRKKEDPDFQGAFHEKKRPQPDKKKPFKKFRGKLKKG